MMRSVTLIILLDFLTQSSAKDMVPKQIAAQHSMFNSVEKSSDLVQDESDKFVDVLVNQLVDRMLMVHSLHQADLESTTLGKPGNVRLPASQPQGLATVHSPGLRAPRPSSLLEPSRMSWGHPALHSPSLEGNAYRGSGNLGPRQSRGMKVRANTGTDADTNEKTSEPTSQTFATVADYKVIHASDEEEVSLSSLLAKDKNTVFGFLTHFGDFNCWELAQGLLFAKPQFAEAGADIRLVGIGSVASARKFASMLGIDAASVYADPTASIYKALKYSQGFMPESNLNGYVKLFPMLLGIGSPGTIGAVLSGYRGNPTARRDWVASSLQQGNSKGRFPSFTQEGLWNIIGKEGLRPFEMATLRLQNMVGVLNDWKELAPEDDQLVVQQGGAMIVRPDGSTIYTYADRGILTYADVDELLAQVKTEAAAPEEAAAAAAAAPAPAAVSSVSE